MDTRQIIKLKKLLREWDGEGILTKYGIDDLAMYLNGALSCENGEVKVCEQPEEGQAWREGICQDTQ